MHLRSPMCVCGCAPLKPFSHFVSPPTRIVVLPVVPGPIGHGCFVHEGVVVLLAILQQLLVPTQRTATSLIKQLCTSKEKDAYFLVPGGAAASRAARSSASCFCKSPNSSSDIVGGAMPMPNTVDFTVSRLIITIRVN